MKDTQKTKRGYVKPAITRIELDNELSLVMLTLPPDDGVRIRPSFGNLLKFRFPF